MVPNGFVNVKKEVKQSRAKGNKVSITVVALYVHISSAKVRLIYKNYNISINSFKSFK